MAAVAPLGPAEPHARREYAVECVFACGRLVLDKAGAFSVPVCDSCKSETETGARA